MKTIAWVWLALLTALLGVRAQDLPDWKRKLQPETDAWKRMAQHFMLNNDTEPETLDPAVATGVQEDRLITALFEGLCSLDPVTLQPRPGMATHWEVSEDGLVYTFHLRADATWSDGKPLTTADFVYAWKRVLDPAFGADYAAQLYPLKNAEAYRNKQVTDFGQVGVQAVDDLTLQVTLHAPCRYFLDLSAFYTLFPVPSHVVEAHGKTWTQPQHIVSNGAFRLTEWKPRQYIKAERNPYYWDRDFVKLETVTFYPYDDLDTAYKLYQQGKIHWMASVPPNKVQELQHDPDYYRYNYFGTYFYRFNTTRAPFTDARVRRAFAMTINRDEIAAHILKGGQRPAGWFCPPVAGYEPIAGLAFDPEGAKKLLAEAGYGPTKPLPPIEIFYNTHERHKQIAEYIAQQWRAILGADVTTLNMEWKAYLERMDTMQYQVMRSSWIGDYADPNTFFDLFIKDGGNNRTGWSNPQYTEWLKASQTEPDLAKRNAIYAKMETMLVVDEAVVAPIYMYVSQGMLREEVLGWYDNIRDLHPLKYIWLEPVE